MKSLLFSLILCSSAWCQTTPPPTPTPLSYAVLLSPASPAFVGLTGTAAPIFPAVLYVYVYVQNAQVGMTYVISATGATKNNGSYSLPGQTTLNNPWTVLTFNLQIGDTLAGAPLISLFSPAGVALATVLTN